MRDGVLKHFEVWVLVSDDEDAMGFMGLIGNKVESIFLAPEHFRCGGGRLLIEYARVLKGRLRVDVYEENLSARSFYESVGFVVDHRSERDSFGWSFPILHMRERSL